VKVSKVSVCFKPWTDSMVNVIGVIGWVPKKRDDDRAKAGNTPLHLRSIGHGVFMRVRKTGRETETVLHDDRSIRRCRS
jgi:hypothetical protein